MDSQVLWQVILGTFATAVVADVIVSLAKHSPQFLLAPYFRLWKESALLLRVLHNEDFSQWKPQAARYVALRAIMAQGANQESPQPVLDLLESFLKRNEPVVLVGEPGAGKTTALRALTYRLARRALLYDCLIWLALLIVTAVLLFTAPVVTIVISAISFAAPVVPMAWLASFLLWEALVRRSTVPLFIEARSPGFGNDVNEWCERIFKKRLGEKPLIGARRRVALFIDGVNEVEASLFSKFVEGWSERLRDKRACRVIFASRGGEENPAKRLGAENVLSVCDLDDDGVREFLKVYGGEKAAKENIPYNVEQAHRDFAELQKKNLLGERSIGRNPYWLKLIVKSGLYTVNRGALFRNFAEELIRREIVEKPEERKRKPDWKNVPVKVVMDALAALALAMHQEKRIGFIDEEGWNKADRAICKSIGGLSYKLDDVLGEAEAATLLRVQLKERIEFVHQLVQEFFAAYALQPEAKWQDALSHCEDVWWWQTLFHMGGLVGADNCVEPYSELVRKVLGDGSNEQRVFAAIGLLRSVEDAPSELSSAVIGAFGELMEGNLILREGATTLNLTDQQLRAIHNLTRALGEEATEAFALLLEDSRIETQIIGILILSIVGSRCAAELIIRKLNDSIYGFVGVTPLIRMGAPAIERLIAAFRDEDTDVRRRAADALVRIGAPSVEPLIAALRDEDTVHWRAEYALVRIGAPSVGPLIAALRDEGTDVRVSAAHALKQIGDTRAVEPLIGALRDDDRSVRWSAVEALGRIGDMRAVEPLIAALRDEDRDVRWSAVEALGRIGDMRAVEPLIAALRDKNADVSMRASHALGKIGAPSVEPLIAALRDDDRDVRRRAAYELGEIGDPRALYELVLIADVDDMAQKATEKIWRRLRDKQRKQ